MYVSEVVDGMTRDDDDQEEDVGQWNKIIVMIKINDIISSNCISYYDSTTKCILVKYCLLYRYIHSSLLYMIYLCILHKNMNESLS